MRYKESSIANSGEMGNTMGLKLHLFGPFAAHANGRPVEFLYKGRNGVILACLLITLGAILAAKDMLFKRLR